MKTLLTALILTTLTGPVLALNLPATVASGIKATEIVNPSADQIDRRSGRCPHHPEQPMIAGQAVQRERSTNTCGGV